MTTTMLIHIAIGLGGAALLGIALALATAAVFWREP